jgi:carboxymethylenebutenolidase
MQSRMMFRYFHDSETIMAPFSAFLASTGSTAPRTDRTMLRPQRAIARTSAALAAALAAGPMTVAAQAAMDHSAHAAYEASAPSVLRLQDDPTLPAGSATVAARLAASPRHGEYMMVPRAPGSADSIRAWVVFPERRDRAPVVIVVHEIFGVSTWIRGVADQLAAEGFIAVAPDLLSGKYSLPSPADTLPQAQATAIVRALNADSVQRDIGRVAEFAMALPSAQRRFGVVGFCWGGSTSFNSAVTAHPQLRGAVVYYGTSPTLASLTSVRAPVLGLYGADDARVNATVAPADSVMRGLNKSFEFTLFPGAGHGFLRQQDGREGANLAATRAAWPRTVAFFRRTLR